MALRFHDHGDEVRALQHALIDLGYPLPSFGADSWLGRETLDAVGRLLDEHGRHFDADGTSVSDEELAFVLDLHARLLGQAGAPPPPRLVDLRALAGTHNDYGARPWTRVTGICLHQTACVLGEKPERWAAIGAHIGITRGGQVILLHDFHRLIVHGNGWNTECVGIELDGMYAGVEGDLRTFWRPPSEPHRQPQAPTAELIAAAQATIRWIKSVVESRGGHLRALVAHRQASRDRQADPGSALWQQVAVPLHRQLGLTDGGIGFKLGSGYAIPEAWDARCKGIRY